MLRMKPRGKRRRLRNSLRNKKLQSRLQMELRRRSPMLELIEEMMMKKIRKLEGPT
jgi:hypothetical protein